MQHTRAFESPCAFLPKCSFHGSVPVRQCVAKYTITTPYIITTPYNCVVSIDARWCWWFAFPYPWAVAFRLCCIVPLFDELALDARTFSVDCSNSYTGVPIDWRDAAVLLYCVLYNPLHKAHNSFNTNVSQNIKLAHWTWPLRSRGCCLLP